MLEILEKVSCKLLNRKVVTREELDRIVLRTAFEVLGDEIKNVSKEDLQEISRSFIECPISIKNLHFSEEFEVYGIKFYHPHTVKPSKEDFEIAYMEFLKSKKLFDNLEEMKRVTDRFFKNYKSSGEFFRVYNGKSKYGVFYSTIEDLQEDLEIHKKVSKNFNGEYVVCVVTEESVQLFYRFFKRMSEEVKRAGIKVWVVDPHSKCIDPLVGYPRDVSLIEGFRNPKIATIINSLWRVNVEKID